MIADLPGGRTDRTVVSGAHLDSVIEGPGINDNGSGSAGQLETALELAASEIEPVNHVRFIWFGAEESGLVGSQYYVDSLTARDEGHRGDAQLRHDRLAQRRLVRVRR